MDILRSSVLAVKSGAKSMTGRQAWILEKHPMTFADEKTWSNRDTDVTPLEHRTWTSWTVLSYWMSDALSVQSWAAASAIITVGLTWREAVYCLILGIFTVTIPLCLNGAAGAELHVPFPVIARSGFGFVFSRFAVILRMATALFYHAIQTYSGSTAMTQVIRAIWPSYLDIPNQLPASAGITTQEMVSHLIFWSAQLPILLIPPHKLRWFFVFKAVIVLLAATGTVIGMTSLANGAGEIWNQQPTVSGATKSWLIASSMSSITGGWATMATNVADFTRYMRRPQGVYWQTLFVLAILTMVGVYGIISTSSAKVVYDEYIWDPVDLASRWQGSGGRAAAFFVGVAWCIAQIGTNLSANVISCANDMTSLWPKYINIRRGVIITTVTAGWVMVPWKIISSASSLLNFMGALGVFLAPIAALLASDYWVVKRRAVDIPALYRRRGRYSYDSRIGTNWRAAVAVLVGSVPNMPGMATAVKPSLDIGGASKIYDMFYLYGFTSTFVVYFTLSWMWPAKDALVEKTIHEDVLRTEGVEVVNDGIQDPHIIKLGQLKEAKYIEV